MIILRATNDDGVKVDLDIIESNAPIRLDISAIENTQIGQAFGVSSQTFSLPGTPKNNAFFGNLFDLGTTPAVALQNSISCQVLTDGAQVFTGKLYITDIVTDQRGYTTYQVNVVNETVDFKFQLTDTLLSELDFSEYNHQYSYANITSSWSEQLFSGSIIYPHVNYGQPEGDTTIPEYAFNGTRTFDTVNYPLRVDQFKPAIKVKDVVDKIFNSTSYLYTSSFFDSEYFNSLYTLTTPFDGLGVLNANAATGSAWAYSTGTQNFNALTSYKVNYNAEVFDNFNRFDLTNDRYTAYATGLYNFAVGFTFSIANYDVNRRGRFFVRLAKNGTNLGPARVYPNVPQNGQLYVPFPNINLVNGDYLEVFLEYQTDDGSEVITLGGGQNSTYFKVEGPRSFGGGQVDMSLQFPNDLKCVDYLQGLIEKFNLVVEPVPNTRNLLRIEPYNTWVAQGKVVDWTNKVDRGTRFKIVHPIIEQPKFIFFKDEDDEAINNRYTQNNFGDTFGSYTYSNDSDLCLGDRRVGKVFAATPVKGIPNGDTMVIPHLCRVDQEVNANRPFKFKPRLLHKNGLKPVPSTAAGSSGSLNTFGTYWFQDETFVLHRLDKYYQMTTFDDVPTSFTSGSDLHFGNLNWYQYFQYTGLNGRTRNDAFQTYWANYINSLYDIDARKLTCNVWLRPTDIQDIALNDKVFIDGHYYRINKISGANISYEDTIEVELIKELNRQLNYPRRRTILGTVPQDIQVREVQENGVVVYEDFDGGVTVSDFGRIKQAAFKDGYTVFETAGNTGSVSWTTPAPILKAEQKAVYGNNDVDVSSNAMFVAGGNNTVANNTSNGFIIGNDNEIKAGTINSTITGVGNTIEVLQNNVSILGATGAAMSGSNNNSVIIGGTGSVQFNNDWVVQINGYTDGVRNSDNTTAITSGENEVIVNGSGHTVLTLNREGGGLDLLEKRNKSNYLGDTYLGGGLLIDSYTINVGDGTQYWLTGSLYGQGKHESVYLLNWNGLSPGTASIYLPSAANNDYKGTQYTFKANGTFDGGTYLQLVPFNGTQFIDGQAEYALTSEYDVVTIINTGSQWYILNTAATKAGAYGGFYSTSSQAIATPGVSQSVLISETLQSDGVFISGSRIYFEKAGVYQFSYIAQVENVGNAQEEANFWIKYNGVDFPHSNTLVSIPPAKNPSTPGFDIMTAIFTNAAQNDNDYIELYWNGSSTDLRLYYSSSNGQPETPSVIANVISIGGAQGLPGPAGPAGPAGPSGSGFPFTGSAEITGSLTVTGSISGSFNGNFAGVTVGGSGVNTILGGGGVLSNLTTGDANTAIGERALFNTTDGDGNTAVGYLAGFTNTSGDRNTTIGERALFDNSVGSSNIALGYSAGRHSTGSNQLFIDSITRGNLEDAKTRAIIYGSMSSTAADQQLRINAGDFRLPYLPTGSYGQSLSYDSSTGRIYRTENLVLSGSIEVSGSLRGNYIQLASAGTASLDFNTGNFFEITLTGSGATHISASNVAVGQTVNVIVNTGTNATGTVTFNSVIKQPSGSSYTPTQAANSIDALSIVSGYSGSDAVGYVVSVKNFI